MTTMTVYTNDKITAVFHRVNEKISLTYFTVDGELLKSAWITKDAGNSVYHKLLTKGYKMVAQVARA